MYTSTPIPEGGRSLWTILTHWYDKHSIGCEVVLDADDVIVKIGHGLEHFIGAPFQDFRHYGLTGGNKLSVWSLLEPAPTAD